MGWLECLLEGLSLSRGMREEDCPSCGFSDYMGGFGGGGIWRKIRNYLSFFYRASSEEA